MERVVVEESAVPGPVPEPVAIAIVFVDPVDVAAAVDDDPYALFAIAYELFRGNNYKSKDYKHRGQSVFSTITL